MKGIANCISFSRIILSLSLLFVKPLGAAFYAIYIICGFSDMVDGYIARRTKSVSKLGAKLDSLADFIMALVLLFLLYPILKPSLIMGLWIAVIALIRFAAMAVARVKFGSFAFLHTYGNKITGMMIFIFPLMLPILQPSISIYVICAVATVSAVEELIIQVISKELMLDRQSVFSVFGGRALR